MIKKIGIQNFRVFKEFTEFEIKPITLLVGPNNAGKSSFTKLLLLLKNGITKLNFEDGLHNLESFDKVLNWETHNKFLKIRYDNQLGFLEDNFFVDVVYTTLGKNNEIVAINIANKDESLLSFTLSRNQVNSSPIYRLNFNINLMMTLMYHNKRTNFSQVKDNREIWHPGAPEIGELGGSQKIYEGDLSIENYEEIYKSIMGYGFEDNGLNSNSEIGKIVLKHEIRKLERDFLLYDIFINGKKATQYHREEIIEMQKLQFSKVNSNANDILINQLENCLLNANEQVKIEIKNYFLKSLKEQDVKIKETRLGRLFFTEKLFESVNDNVFFEDKKPNYQKTFFQQFGNFMKGLDEDFNTLEYISANRGSQKRILSNKSENDIDKIVLDFFNKSDKNIIYLENIFSILEIPGKLTVERFENVISVVYLTINDKKVALSDLGFGYSQLIPIILKITTITATSDKVEWKSEKEWTEKRQSDQSVFEFFGTDRNRILIIEEPEANLHPSLQSKLADMLVATIAYYPFINFVIETHSEYLIRKLQFLTADEKIDTEKSIIYYFNADKYVTATEPKVKTIRISENGNLSDTFGSGFYDEATHLQFNLMKLNQEQSN
jgi:predicted ATPase